jgi:hypothetical protein
VVIPVKGLTVVNTWVKGEVDHGVQLAMQLLDLGMQPLVLCFEAQRLPARRRMEEVKTKVNS